MAESTCIHEDDHCAGYDRLREGNAALRGQVAACRRALVTARDFVEWAVRSCVAGSFTARDAVHAALTDTAAAALAYRQEVQREARREMRERAANLARTHGLKHPGYCQGAPHCWHDIAAAIEALPEEP